MISGLAHLVIACLKSKFVNLFSLHPDYLTVFNKMIQEQDKLKCCKRLLKCREYRCFDMTTKFAMYTCLCSLEVRSDTLLFTEMSKFG